MIEKNKAKRQEEGDAPQDNPKKRTKMSVDFFRSTAISNVITKEATDDFRFHNHLLTNGGMDLREDKKKTPSKVYRAVIPNSPLISRRFYDWPPNPSLSRVERLEPVTLNCFYD